MLKLNRRKLVDLAGTISALRQFRPARFSTIEFYDQQRNTKHYFGEEMKRLLQALFLVALTAILSPSLFAQPPGGRGGPPEGGHGGPGQSVLKALDIDGNHEISAVEIANASAALSTLDSNGDGKLSEADNANGQGGRGGPNGQQGRGNRGNINGQQGRGGPPGGGQGRPNPEQFVTHAMEFDVDSDGKLDETELMAFAEKMGPPPHEQGDDNNRRPQRPQR